MKAGTIYNHIKIDGILHKKCLKCKEILKLEEFNKYKRTWDNLMRICKKCHRKQMKEYRKKNPLKTLSPEELKLSYKTRKTTSKAIKGVNSEGNILLFKSGMEASRNGYDKTSIRRSILKNREYKGYKWSYIDEIDRIYARKCTINKVKWQEYKKFLDDYHKQGSIKSTVCYGLYYNNELVCLMSFGKPRSRKQQFEWELYRLCYKNNIKVVGGAGKLLKAFIREYNPKSILSYAISDYKNGGKVYKSLGFTKIGETVRSFHYIKDGVKYSRQRLMKHKLKDILKDKYDETKSGSSMLEENGFVKVLESTNNIYSLIL